MPDDDVVDLVLEKLAATMGFDIDIDSEIMQNLYSADIISELGIFLKSAECVEIQSKVRVINIRKKGK